MGKKYMDTKKGSLEQSVLNVWKDAAEMHEEGFDGRTKEYREHRAKLENKRVKREEKKNKPKMEQPETEHGSGEHAYEVGTDRYDEYTRTITPGQITETFFALGEQVDEEGDVEWTDEQERLGEEILDMPEDHFDDLLEEMTEEELVVFEGILGAIGRGIKKGAKRFGTKQGRASAKLAKAKKKQDLVKTKADIKKTKADTKQMKKDANIGVVAKTKTAAKAAVKGAKAAGRGAKKVAKAGAAGAKKVGAAIKKSAEDLEVPEGQEVVYEAASPDWAEPKNLRDTIISMWSEAASSAVNPQDREELDMDVKDSAKKMKRADEPRPNVTEEVDLDEGYLELTFKSKQDAEKAYNKINNEIFAAGSVPYDDMNQEGNEIQFDLDGNLNRRNDILKDLKSGGIKNFKVTANEELDEKLTAKQKKIDVDGDGEIEGSDLAKLRKKAKKEGKTELEVAKEFKVASMKEALAKVWGLEEGGMKRMASGDGMKTFKPKPKEKKEGKKAETGEDVAAVEIDPKIKEKK